jgi:hypothetical protein
MKIFPHRLAHKEEDRLDELCGIINQHLGTTWGCPGSGHHCFWHGNQSAGDEGLYRARLGSKQLCSSPTKDGLVSQLEAFIQKLKDSPDMDQSWVFED